MKITEKQTLHTLAVHLFPLLSIPFAAMFHLGVQPITWFEVLLFCAMWALTGGLGISIGYHRYFTHRAFHAATPLRWVMAACGAMAGQGPVTYWVALHRKHHRHSDRNGDPHSPVANPSATRSRFLGLLYSHLGWIASPQSLVLGRYAMDMLKDPVALGTGKRYYELVLFGQLIPAVIGLMWYGSLLGAVAGLLWGGLLRLVIGNQIIWSVNSVCHAVGKRPYQTPDDSRNNVLVALLAFGEGWHNNHHASPAMARFAHHWWQADLGYLGIRILERLHLIHAVKTSLKEEPTT